MDKKITRRFIGFNMLIIAVISIILTGFVYFGSRSTLPLYRLIITVVLMITLTFVGSVLISRIAVRPIKEAWQKQLDFTADASHELRTPLAVAFTNLELVMESPEETVASQMHWLENIAAENQRMTNLVNDLLILSRADAKQQTMVPQPFMLNELIAETVLPLLTVAESRHISCAFPTDPQIAVNADRERIRQLIVILVDNAVKYTQDGGKITISVAKEKDMVELAVADTGVGIAAGEAERVFDRFFRGNKTRSMHQEGNGLGLAIAKWIVDEHGGAIKVESKPGEGSRFIVKLPIFQSE